MIRNEKGRFESAQEAVSYGFYSKLLKKPFDSVEELKLAEEEYNKAHAAEIKAKEERSLDLAKVQDIANAYFAVIKKNEEARKLQREEEEKAYKAYKAQLDEFAAKHNGYHLTYIQNGNNIEFRIEENHQNEIERYIKDQQAQLRKMFDSFWF